MADNDGIDPHLIGANGSGPSGRSHPAERSSGAGDEVDLQDKVALILDGTTADAQGLALALARRGMHVIFLYFREEHGPAAAVKDQVEAQERRCLLISWADLCDDDGAKADAKRFAQQAMEQIRANFGGLDVFVDLSARPRPLNKDGAPQTQKPSLRARLFPHLNIMKAALNQIAESDPDA